MSRRPAAAPPSAPGLRASPEAAPGIPAERLPDYPKTQPTHTTAAQGNGILQAPAQPQSLAGNRPYDRKQYSGKCRQSGNQPLDEDAWDGACIHTPRDGAAGKPPPYPPVASAGNALRCPITGQPPGGILLLFPLTALSVRRGRKAIISCNKGSCFAFYRKNNYFCKIYQHI